MECDDEGNCGEECLDIELTKQPCPSEESCIIENSQSKCSYNANIWLFDILAKDILTNKLLAKDISARYNATT